MIQPTYTELCHEREKARRQLEAFKRENNPVITAYHNLAEIYQTLTNQANKAYLEDIKTKTVPQ
jgi:hypothetical protein